MRRETNARQRRTRGPTTHRRAAAPRPDGWQSLAALAVGAQRANVIKHGQQFHENDLQQIQPGMSQEQVRMNLGTPSTTAVIGNSRPTTTSPARQSRPHSCCRPRRTGRSSRSTSRRPASVDRVANYGMKDGKVFDFVSRTTPAPGGKDDGIVKQLFRNLGQKQIFGDGY